MATKTCTFTYEGTVTPKETKFLKSEPIKMNFTTTYDLDQSDAALEKTIQDQFKALLGKAIAGQLDHLNKWLAEKNTLLETMVKRSEKLKAAPLPTTAAAVAEFVKGEKEIQEIAKNIDAWKKDYQQIVTSWAENCREQQGRIAMQAALKAARVKTLNDKSFRVKAGMAVKGVLIVLGVAAAIAAIVLTAGTTAPVFVALAGAGVALSGLSGFAAIGKSIKENADIEKKILASAEKDVQSIQSAFGGLKDKGGALRKHITELSNLIKVREGRIKELENDLLKFRAEARKYFDAVKALHANPMVNEGELRKKEAALNTVGRSVDEAEKKVAALRADNKRATELIAGLADLGLNLDKFAGQGPGSVLGNLKARYTSLDGWIDLGGQLGSLSSGASALHS